MDTIQGVSCFSICQDTVCTKGDDSNRNRLILYTRVLSDIPRFTAIARVAATVRFSVFAIFVTPLIARNITHQASLSVGQCKHLGRYSMRTYFLISAAAIGLIAGAGFANAQGTGMGRESGGAAAQQSAPQGGNSAAPSNREAKEPSAGMKSTQKEDKSGTKSTEEKSGAAKGKSAEETAPGQKSKSMSSENEAKGKD